MKKIDENYFKNEKANTEITIDTILSQDEQVLWMGKPKKSAYLFNSFVGMLPFVLLWLFIDVGVICMVFLSDTGLPSYAIAIIIPFMLFHLMPVWIWITKVLTAKKQHKNLDYVFTNQRIIIKSGIIGIDFVNIYYADIESVNLKVGLVDKIFKVGDIYIKSNSKSQVLFDIEDPYFIVSKLQKIVIDIKADIQFPNNLRPIENKGYNTTYTGQD